MCNENNELFSGNFLLLLEDGLLLGTEEYIKHCEEMCRYDEI